MIQKSFRPAGLMLLLLFSVFLSFAQTGRFFDVRGKEIIGPDGQPFLMKGTNLGNWLVPEGYMFRFDNTPSPRLINQALTELVGPGEAAAFWKAFLENYITEKDIRYLKSIGCNSIRIPFHYKLFTDEEYMGGNDAARGFKYMDRVIDWCRKYGLYVLLDMHCAPGGQTGDNIDDSWGHPFLFDDPVSQKTFMDVWVSIAKHYANNATVIGYDLLNEPIAHFFDTAHFNPKLEPLYKEATKAIRAVDKNHLVFLGGAQWDSNFRIFGKPFDSKLVYTFHKYWTEPTTAVIQDYLDFRDKYNVPIYCGETGENKDEWVQQFRETMDSHRVGWHYWPYKKMENKAGIVDFAKPEGFSLIQAYADSTKKNFEVMRNIRPKDMNAVRAALKQFLENCRFENCRPNKGYIQALGFRSE
jgi:aryl-phospho-beta-D-glucosidase BglC (GH1 family)